MDDPERGGGPAGVEPPGDDGARPPADSREPTDILFAVRTLVCSRLADDSGPALELPEQFSSARVDGLEPTVHRSVEGDVASGDERSAPDGKIFLDLPRWPAVGDVPGE